jgi:hypothetical protein
MDLMKEGRMEGRKGERKERSKTKEGREKVRREGEGTKEGR